MTDREQELEKALRQLSTGEGLTGTGRIPTDSFAFQEHQGRMRYADLVLGGMTAEAAKERILAEAFAKSEADLERFLATA